jgi:hypothetical protein
MSLLPRTTLHSDSEQSSVEMLAKQMKSMNAKMASLEAKLSDVLEVNKNLKVNLKAKDKSIEDLSTGYSNLVSR